MSSHIEFDAIVRLIGTTKYIPIPKDFDVEKGESVRIIAKKLIPMENKK